MHSTVEIDLVLTSSATTLAKNASDACNEGDSAMTLLTSGGGVRLRRNKRFFSRIDAIRHRWMGSTQVNWGEPQCDSVGCPLPSSDSTYISSDSDDNSYSCMQLQSQSTWSTQQKLSNRSLTADTSPANQLAAVSKSRTASTIAGLVTSSTANFKKSQPERLFTRKFSVNDYGELTNQPLNWPRVSLSANCPVSCPAVPTRCALYR